MNKPLLSSELAEFFRPLVDLVCQPSFVALLKETMSLPESVQHEFIEIAWLDPAILKQRGVVIPDGVTVERSWFADQRPTLFCVVAHLPAGYGWEKITFTFDALRGLLPEPVWS